MKRNALLLTLLCTIASLAAHAGDIKGKVGGASGVSVVWVEAVPGKTFPAPEKHVVVDRTSFQFSREPLLNF